MKAFQFTTEEVLFIQRLQKSGQITTAESDQILEIYRKRIDPNYDFCTSCPDSMRSEYARLKEIVCSTKEISNLRTWKPETEDTKEEEKKPDQTPVTKSQILELSKNEIIELVKDRTGQEINPSTRVKAREQAFELFDLE